MKKLFIFLSVILVWQLIGSPVTINVTFGDKKQVRAAVGTLTIDQSVSGAITSAKFSDSSNTAYYVDPAASVDSAVFAGKVTAGSFSGDGSLLTGISGTPAGTVVFYNGAACPTGWTEYTAARGFTIVGLPASGTLNGTVGTALTNLLDRTHTHTGSSHAHTITSNIDTSASVYGGGTQIAGTQTTSAGGNGATGTAATSNVMPYIQLLVCQKS